MPLTLSHLTHTYRRAAKPTLSDVLGKFISGFCGCMPQNPGVYDNFTANRSLRK